MPNSCKSILNRMVHKGAMTEEEKDKILRNMPRWIPCDERLPEPMKAVLGYAPKWKNVFALYYDLEYGWMVWSPISDDCFPNMYGDIVAWMPMPEYEEET